MGHGASSNGDSPGASLYVALATTVHVSWPRSSRQIVEPTANGPRAETCTGAPVSSEAPFMALRTAGMARAPHPNPSPAPRERGLGGEGRTAQHYGPFRLTTCAPAAAATSSGRAARKSWLSCPSARSTATRCSRESTWRSGRSTAGEAARDGVRRGAGHVAERRRERGEAGGEALRERLPVLERAEERD